MLDFWRPASFRGVPFFVSSYERSGGRRGPDHEFPGKDEGYPEDTGKSMEEFSIDAYVVRSVRDPDYAARRDALIQVANQKGPGDLIHPAFGTVRVQLRSWSVSETKDSLGLAPIRMSFQDASAPSYPSAKRATVAGMEGAAAAAHKAAAAGFSNAFAVSGKSDFLRDSAQADASAIGNVFSSLAAAGGVPFDMGVLSRDLSSAIEQAADRTGNFAIAAAAAAFPVEITRWFEAPFAGRRNADGTYRGRTSFRGNGPLPAAAVTSLYRAYDFNPIPPNIGVVTATRAQQAENSFALAHLVRLSTAIETGRVAPFIDWQTLQEAEAARDRVAFALDLAAEQSRDDVLCNALTEMRVLVLRTVPPEESQLPALMDYRTPMTMPSLTLSYRLYGDSGRAEEIARLNRLIRPGFVPGMETIQVISDAVR